MRRSYWVLLAVFAVATLIGTGSPAWAVDNGQIGIQPANEPDYFHVNLAPGAAIQETAVISNHTNAPVTLLTYPVDGRTTPQGGFGFAAQSDPRKNVGDWAHLPTSQLVVPAHSQSRLPFQLTIPAKTPPGDYYGGVVIQSPPVAGKTVTVQGGTSVQLNIVQRQAVRIYLTVSGTRNNKLETGPLTWKQHNGHVDFSLPIRNTGNTILHPTSSLTLASPLGHNQTLRFNTPESLLPGDAIALHATIENPAPVQIGTATAREHSEAGFDSATTAFTYIPWGILVGTTAAIGLLVILGFRLARFMRRARRAIALTEARSQQPSGTQ